MVEESRNENEKVQAKSICYMDSRVSKKVWKLL